MIGRLRALVRIALLALPGICVLPWQSSAQVAPPGNVQFNEVQIAAEAFSLGEPVPTWIAPITMPEPGQSEPMQLRLADTQYLVGQKPVVYVRRALLINDAA